MRLSLANVTDTARTLERNHLCGPIAGLVQAELIGAVTLMGTQLSEPGQTLSLRLNLPDGLLRGATLECAYGYDIRGYTRQKVLATLDDSNDPNEVLFDKALGRSASCAVVISDPRGKSSEAHFDLSFKDRLTITDIAEEYFCTSLQRRALVQLSAASKAGYVECSHALLCDFLPEASDSLYAEVEAKFANGSVQDALDAGKSLRDLAKLLGLDAGQESSHPVRFFCPCSNERVMAMLRALPKADLEAMIAEQKNVDIYCHMCGKGYTVTPDHLRSLL